MLLHNTLSSQSPFREHDKQDFKNNALIVCNTDSPPNPGMLFLCLPTYENMPFWV